MLNIEADNNAKTAAGSIHVAVAVIVKDGHFLISKRAQNVHQGGLWEFPGGKVETGETTTEALCREIKEELGINIKKSRPLIKISHHYLDKSVLLETLIVTVFDGKEYVFENINKQEQKQEQLGLEGQQVRWVTQEQLDKYHFPQANQAIINALKLPDTYLITPDCKPEPGHIKQFLEQFSDSIQQHSLVQLRIKHISERQELNQLIQQVSDIANIKNGQILLNSSMLLTSPFCRRGTEEGANLPHIIRQTDGLHLTSCHLHDLSKDSFIQDYRQQFPEKKIAASCHDKNDIERANHLELDFIVVSPVQHTASHPEQKPLGWEQFKDLVESAEMPVYALGGMTANDINQAQNYGAQGISAIRSLWNK